MNEHRINTAQAGEEEDYIWVSLHFESPQTEEDRIHIVCATSTDEQDEANGMNASMNAIYLERLDQSLAGYGLATSIRVTASAVELEITPDGLQQLEFPGSLRLLWSPALEGYQTAQKHLARMGTYECGKVVQVA
jgi:hypothetical protein